jgi:hypothetical protein
MERTKKIVRGEELWFYNYKEPLRRYIGGHGFMGVLAHNREGDRVQCHICGNFYQTISPSHVKTHGFETLKAYKDEVGLAYTTALISEPVREKLVKIFFEQGLQRKLDLKSNKKFEQERIERLIASNKSRTGERLRLEKRNLRGNCPDQLLDKLKVLKKELGKVPTKRDFRAKYKGRFLGTIYQTFGSWTNAVKKAGMTPISETPGAERKYTDKQLLDYLKEFHKMHSRLASHSDFDRGLLPAHSTYIEHFGSMNKARVRAKLPILIQISGTKWVEYKPTKEEQLNILAQ